MSEPVGYAVIRSTKTRAGVARVIVWSWTTDDARAARNVAKWRTEFPDTPHFRYELHPIGEPVVEAVTT